MTPARREMIGAVAVAGVALAAIGGVGFALAAVLPGASSSRGPGETGTTSGRLLFRQHCARCHAPQAQGRGAFPPLANVGLGREDVEVVVRAGIPPLMPAFGNRLRADQIQALAEYVASLNGDARPGMGASRDAPEAAARGAGGGESAGTSGRLVFRRQCAGCHGAEAQGRGAAPPLANVGLGPGEVEAAVRSGIPPLMPALGDRLRPDQIRAVADYVGSLNRGRGAGPDWAGAPAAAWQPGAPRGRTGGMGCCR